jgi:tetratricopeptide (TPR) repeat protein
MVSGAISREKGKYLEARRAFEQVLVRDPLFVPATRDMALLCSEQYPEDPQLYDLALKAREAFPDDPALAKALGIQVFRRGEYARAAQLLTESSQKLKDDADSLYYLGIAQFQLKKREESKQALQKALALNLSPKLAEQGKKVLAELNKPL